MGQADPPAGRFSAVAAGTYHTCGLRADGTITCWGSNSNAYGRQGQADAPGGQYRAVTAGHSHSCGLRTDGTITCWGSHADAHYGQYSAVTAGYRHSCGLRTDGTITCWGQNNFGQPPRPAGSTAPSPPAGTIRADCAPMAASPAGATYPSAIRRGRGPPRTAAVAVLASGDMRLLGPNRGAAVRSTDRRIECVRRGDPARGRWSGRFLAGDVFPPAVLSTFCK